jgi:hypothetical protein
MGWHRTRQEQRCRLSMTLQESMQLGSRFLIRQRGLVKQHQANRSAVRCVAGKVQRRGQVRCADGIVPHFPKRCPQ